MTIPPSQRGSVGSSLATGADAVVGVQGGNSGNNRARVWLLPCAITQVGVAIAEAVLSSGEKVVVPAISECESLRSEYPDDCVLVVLDSCSRSSCDAAVRHAQQVFDHIDVVVTANSKVHVGTLEEVEDWQLPDQMNATFNSVVNVTESVLPVLRQQGHGHIVNLTDTNGILGTPSLSLLSSAMHAVEGYSESIAVTEAQNQTGVMVSIVETSNELTLISNANILSNPSPKYHRTGDMRQLIENASKFPEKELDDVVTAVMAIGGIKNPPMRLIAGADSMELVKLRINMAGEELERFAVN